MTDEVESVLKEPDYEQEATEQPSTEVAVSPEPPKAEEKAPEKAAEKPPETEDIATKYEKTKTALREERRRAKEIEQRAQEYEAKLARAEALEKELAEWKASRKKEQEEQLYQSNPAEYLRQQQEALKKEVEQTREQEVLRQQAEEQQRFFMQRVKSSVQEFAKEAPDYQDAFNYLREFRYKEYEALGIPDDAKDEAFDQESIELAHRSLQMGRNPAEVVYTIAKTRGYGPKQAQTAEQTINRLEKGLEASKSLKGGNPEPSILKSIEDMDDEEFHEWFKKEVQPRKRH